MRRTPVPGPFIVGTLAIGVLVGCAGIRVEPDSDAAAGVRYYQSSPYLLVTTDNDGGLKSELLYLPNLRKKMSARPYSFLAKNDSTLEFENGVLRTGETEGDATVVPKAVLSALEKVATAAIAAMNAPTEGGPKRVPGPVLFRIDVNCGGGQACLVGPQGKVAGGTTLDVFVSGVPAGVPAGGGR